MRCCYRCEVRAGYSKQESLTEMSHLAWRQRGAPGHIKCGVIFNFVRDSLFDGVTRGGDMAMATFWKETDSTDLRHQEAIHEGIGTIVRKMFFREQSRLPIRATRSWCRPASIMACTTPAPSRCGSRTRLQPGFSPRRPHPRPRSPCWETGRYRSAADGNERAPHDWPHSANCRLPSRRPDRSRSTRYATPMRPTACSAATVDAPPSRRAARRQW
jgi:hypothetical protein